MLPPAFFSTLTLSMSILYLSPDFSATARTASTTMSASSFESADTIFDAMDVLAILFRNAFSVGSTLVAISLSVSIAFWDAFLNPSTTTVGWTFFVISSSAFSSNEPASTTVDVVPSPTSLSVDLLISTIILAEGC